MCLGAVAPHVGAWIEISDDRVKCALGRVAPHVGAWIEIALSSTKSTSHSQSHPTWVRGLKFHQAAEHAITVVVAPHVGAWIEMSGATGSRCQRPVAPHVGAWIEIGAS